jgi:hypothetical protein
MQDNIIANEYVDDEDDEAFRTEQLEGRMRFIQQIYLAYLPNVLFNNPKDLNIIADGLNLEAIRKKIKEKKADAIIYVYDKVNEMELGNERPVEIYKAKLSTFYQLAS